MCEDTWFAGGCHGKCLNPVEKFFKIQEHSRCEEFWGFLNSDWRSLEEIYK